VKAIGDAGGSMTLDDLKSYQPVIRAPVRGTYRGYDIVAMPAQSSGGIVLLETLNMLEGFPMRDMKQGSAPSLHVMIEAMKRAYADRARYLGDPAFVKAPIATLIGKDYAARAARKHRPRPCDSVGPMRFRRRRHAKATTPRTFRSSTAAAMRSAIPTR